MDDVLRQVVHVFCDEVKEQAQKIVRAILLMDEDASQVPMHIEELYRQVHSLKGSAASLGIVDLEQLAHNLEEALMPVRRGGGVLTPALADAALRSVDCARLRAEGLVADNDLGAREVAEVTEDLRRLAEEKEGVAGATPVEKSTPAPLPVPVPEARQESDEETLRISTNRLSALERRLDELRAVRGRLDQRTTTALALVASLERMWHDARAHGQRAMAETLYSTLRQMGALKRDLSGDAELAQSNAAELDENLRSMRMVPAVLLGDALHRAVREAGRRTGKEARLELSGGETQIDRRLLEELKNPLIHLVRNAVDHGVESPEVREAVGKPRRANISVALEQRGGEVIVEVRDDGRGIDLQKVQKKAVEKGLIDEAEAARLPERELHELLFRPGFSTAPEVTELSGRGVGLDVVRDAVFKLHGGIEVKSQPGQGTAFILRVPLTIVASEAIIEEGGHSYAVPLSSIERIIRVPRSELHTTGGRVLFHLDGQPLPVVRLAPLLGLTERLESSGYCTVAVMRGAGERAAVVCERLLGSADLVLRPLPTELRAIRLLDSAAILPTGQVLFVLAPRAIVETAVRSDEKPRTVNEPATILVADDSITTRSLLCRVLEASGFRVRTAADGDEALRLAQSETFDLVVSDVRMPRLDGYALTARLRAHAATANLPVVLFSSLDSDEDKRRGSASGANAYLTKGAFERGRLLDVVTELLSRKS